jgi:hypothetical protein
VAALAVVEDLEVLEDRVGELQPGAPSFAVEQLGLHACPESLHHAVVVGVADAAVECRSADVSQCGRLTRQDASRERSVCIVSCVEGRSAKPVSSVTIVSAPAEMAVAAWAAS